MRYKDKKKARERQKKAYDFLVGKGLKPHHVSAIIGNLMQESYAHLDSTIENSIGAVGIAQWLGPRRQDLENFAKERGESFKDFDLQLDFLYKELTSTGNSWGSKAQKQFFDSRTAEEAAALFVSKFERSGEKPGDKGYDNRIRNAKSIYLQYNDPTIYAKNEKGQVVNVDPEKATEEQKAISPKIRAEFYEKNFDLVDQKFAHDRYKTPKVEQKAKEEISSKAHTESQERQFMMQLQKLTKDSGTTEGELRPTEKVKKEEGSPYDLTNITPEGNEFFNFFLPTDN